MAQVSFTFCPNWLLLEGKDRHGQRLAVRLPSPRLLLTESELHEPAVCVNVLDKSMNIYENEGDRGDQLHHENTEHKDHFIQTTSLNIRIPPQIR